MTRDEYIKAKAAALRLYQEAALHEASTAQGRNRAANAIRRYNRASYLLAELERGNLPQENEWAYQTIYKGKPADTPVSPV